LGKKLRRPATRHWSIFQNARGARPSPGAAIFPAQFDGKTTGNFLSDQSSDLTTIHFSSAVRPVSVIGVSPFLVIDALAAGG
jgi:hypothetical protein